MSVLDKRSASIRGMFASIAPRYDLLNHLLSLNVDRLWRRRVAKSLNSLKQGAQILDVCTGTGDLAIELSQRGSVIGIDFCHPMLLLALDKVKSQKLGGRIGFIEADALSLPFAENVFDVVTVSFGVRNLEDLRRGLEEFLRVLRPGGLLVVLEFSRPQIPVFRELFSFYFNWILPAVGRAISGTAGPYRYLPESVQEFPDQVALCRLLRDCGFQEEKFANLSGGVAALHTARKPATGDEPGVKPGSLEELKTSPEHSLRDMI